jgi:hypothetical protein
LVYRARFYFDPNSITMASGNAHFLMLARDDAAVVAYRIELRSFQGDYQIRGVAPLEGSASYATPWITLVDGPQFIEIAWLASSGPDDNNGVLYLLVDDEPSAGSEALDNPGRRVDSVRLGAVSGVDTATRGSYFFDAFVSNWGAAIGPDPSIVLPDSEPPAEAIFADGLESGDFSAWSAVKGNGDLLVTSAAAMEGSLGMETVINDTALLYATDWSPFAEPEYHARFAFDPNGLVMLDGRSHVIFQGLMGSSQVVLRMELRLMTGAYQIRAGALYENGWHNTLWWTISDEPHDLELGWRSSIGDPPAGVLALSVDGVELQRDPVSSNWFQIDFVRLGAVAGLDAGTLGSMYFDAFESWRTTIP